VLNALFASFATVALAVACASLLGFALGWLARDLPGSKPLLGRLLELQGALPTLVAAPLLDRWLELPSVVTLGLLVGGSQGLAAARWLRGYRLLRRARSDGSEREVEPLDAGAMARLAPLRSFVALCALHVVSLEALLSTFELPPLTVTLGSLLAQSPHPVVRLGAVVTLACLFLALDQRVERNPPAVRERISDEAAP
jgi:hypothetical protein